MNFSAFSIRSKYAFYIDFSGVFKPVDHADDDLKIDMS